MQLIPVEPKKARNNLGCILIAIAVTIVVVASSIIFTKPAPSVASDSDACYMAQKFVKEQLKSPSTAEFAPCREPDTVVTRTERLWMVRSWVDAENSFGANLRNDFTAKLIHYPATDTWTLVDSSLVSR